MSPARRSRCLDARSQHEVGAQSGYACAEDVQAAVGQASARHLSVAVAVATDVKVLLGRVLDHAPLHHVDVTGKHRHPGRRPPRQQHGTPRPRREWPGARRRWAPRPGTGGGYNTRPATANGVGEDCRLVGCGSGGGDCGEHPLGGLGGAGRRGRPSGGKRAAGCAPSGLRTWCQGAARREWGHSPGPTGWRAADAPVGRPPRRARCRRRAGAGWGAPAVRAGCRWPRPVGGGASAHPHDKRGAPRQRGKRALASNGGVARPRSRA